MLDIFPSISDPIGYFSNIDIYETLRLFFEKKQQYNYELFSYNKSKNQNIKLKLNIVVYYNINIDKPDSLIVSPMDVIVTGRDFFNILSIFTFRIS